MALYVEIRVGGCRWRVAPVRKSGVYKLFQGAVGDRRWTTMRWYSEMVVALPHRERQGWRRWSRPGSGGGAIERARKKTSDGDDKLEVEDA
jgi:hypothetical protein